MAGPKPTQTMSASSVWRADVSNWFDRQSSVLVACLAAEGVLRYTG